MNPKFLTDRNNNFFSHNKLQIGSSVPTSGSYIVGDVVISSLQTDGIYGWICVLSGSPGTWEPLGPKSGLYLIGDLGKLSTVNKNNIVGALNEIFDKIWIGNITIPNPPDEPEPPIEEPEPGFNWVKKGTWELLGGQLTVERKGLTLQYYDNKLYIIGGYNKKNIRIYDLTTGEFNNDTISLNYNINEHASAVCDGKLYIIGGYYYFDWSHKNTIIIDLETNEKTTIINPYYVARTSAVTVDKDIYLIGGSWAAGSQANISYSNDIKKIDTLTNTMTSLNATLQYEIGDSSIAECDGVIYCIGGNRSNGDVFAACKYNQIYDIDLDTTSIKTNIPTAISYGEAFNVGDEIVHVFGEGITDVYAYDTITDTWNTESSTMNNPRYNSGVAVDKENRVAYVAGGESATSGDILMTLEKYTGYIKETINTLYEGDC